MKAKRIHKINQKIVADLRQKNEKINLLGGDGMFNHRCFENSVHKAFENEMNVVEIIYITADGTPVLHYINESKGDYVDNTLGVFAVNLEAYYIRHIPKEQWLGICDVFEKSLDYYLFKNTSWFERTILKIDRLL